MDEETKRQMANLEMKIDAVYATTEKVRKYFLWTLIITIALVVVPAIGLVFAIPSFVNTYTHMDSIGVTGDSPSGASSMQDTIDEINSLLQ